MYNMASSFKDKNGKTFLTYMETAPPEKLREKAKNDFGETEQIREESLKEFRKIIADHSLATITTDEFLLRFLRHKKFRLQESFEKLKNYADFRVSINDNFCKLKPETIRELFRLKVFGILPYRDSEDRPVIYLRAGIWDEDVCSWEEFLMALTVCTYYVVEMESSDIVGLVGILENCSIPLLHCIYCVRYIRFLQNLALECLPARYSRGHILNENSALKYLYRVAYLLIPKKLRKRILFHGKTRDKLFQHIPPCILPHEFGGTLGPLDNEGQDEILIDYLQKMKGEQRYFLPQG